ncbi:MAG: ribonuclease P [Thermoplasmataceae archaeon]|jgi:ribonuclease P protein subunit RPR2
MNRKDANNLAEKRINYLVNLSMKHSDVALAQRYINIARKIGRRMDITLPREIKRSFCKNCNTPYSSKSTIRLKDRMIVIKCSFCGDKRRIPF